MQSEVSRQSFDRHRRTIPGSCRELFVDMADAAASGNRVGFEKDHAAVCSLTKPYGYFFWGMTDKSFSWLHYVGYVSVPDF